ncbi:hypothetical protein GH714_031141 [Hevea brasiliensis]|uniref:Serpin domain-containing protein n=1 Tax=Hevea brasiliensis TaxID=3981 RepID=A0A6A6LG42_HEVBR|nr:hypothetical protein GH714_031141 [Hevea brasiliensis]
MTRDPRGQVHKLASFLGRPLGKEADVDNVLWRCSFGRLKNLEYFSANESKCLETGPTISFVNGAWVDQTFGLKPSYEEVLKGVYHATAKEVDFVNKADQVIDEVNLWVEDATKGLIRNLLPQHCLESDTALVLANAIYFKGAWDRKFDELKTKQKEFHLLSGQIVQAPFMTSKAHEIHLYGSFDGYKVLKLPYQTSQDNRQFSMYFLLPNAIDGLHSLIQTFQSNPEVYNSRFELQEEELPEFWIPRFKFSFKFEASDTLKELGLEQPFNHLAEFTEMVDSPNLLVLSKIFHESCIEVNEGGTEAAASTAPEFRWLCARLNPPSFVADHPFMFMIKEEKSGIVFFIGAVLNPLLVT